MSDHSFTITLKNNSTEKEGIRFMESLDKGYFSVDKTERYRILELLDKPKRFSRSFDMVFIPNWQVRLIDFRTIETHINELVLIELKCTKKFLPNNPKGFFFGATQNEFEFGESLGERYRFCFVSLHPESLSYSTLSIPELEEIMRVKRIQYQINL